MKVRRLNLGLMIIGYYIIISAGPAVFAISYTNVTLDEASSHLVRYTSDKTVYSERLNGDQWVCAYWSADGRIPFPFWLDGCKSPFRSWPSQTPAFEIEVRFDPQVENKFRIDKGWKWVSGSMAKAENGSKHYKIALTNTIHPIDVKVHTLLDGTAVMTRRLEITNTSQKAFAITTVYPWINRFWSLNLGMQLDLGYHTNGAHTIGWFQWQNIPAEGVTKIESTQGLAFDDPFFIVRDQTSGEYVIGHLAWPTNWQMEFNAKADRENPEAGLTIRIGPKTEAALRVLAPGETIETPAVHLGYLEGDLDTAVQAMHEHIRKSVLLPHGNQDRAYRIEMNIPGDNGYHLNDAFNEEAWMDYIDQAAALGCESILIDCGWSDKTTSEWDPLPRRFPNGLEPLRKYAHKKGLLFGLQTECEGGRENYAALFAEHPDWQGPCNVLRLDKPEVEEFMLDLLTRFMDRYRPDLYRHEYIPNCLEKGHFQFEWIEETREGFKENCYWRYYAALQRIFDTIHEKYPNVVLQMCSNGGTREDLSMIQRFHESYTTEAGPPHALNCYSGKTMALPPEILVMGLHTWPWRGMLDTRLRMLYGLSTPQIVTGEAPDMENLSPVVQERYLHYADIYKNFIRPIMPTCKVYHHEPVNSHQGTGTSPWFAMEYAAPNRNKAWAIISRLSRSDSDHYLFRPRGLDVGKTYRVTFDSLGTSTIVDGLQLVQEGLLIRLEMESLRSSELLLFEAHVFKD